MNNVKQTDMRNRNRVTTHSVHRFKKKKQQKKTTKKEKKDASIVNLKLYVDEESQRAKEQKQSGNEADRDVCEQSHVKKQTHHQNNNSNKTWFNLLSDNNIKQMVWKH
eukprot:m.123199 g.123199  ORF g.123199 m.123199 type:complete len:108 (+) comp13748_c0_seq1:3491-3814(+)